MNTKKYIFIIIPVVVIIFLGIRLKDEKSSASTKIEFDNFAEDNVVEATDEDIETDGEVANGGGIDSEEASSEISSEISSEVSKVAGTVSMTSEFLDSDLLKISVNTSDIQQPVLGLAFHLSFDPEKIQFLRYDPGEFLEIGGDPFYLVALSEQKDKIIFGETLRHNDSFPVGGGKISDFYFQISTGSEFDFAFEKGVISTLDSTRQDIDKIDWQNLNLKRSASKQIFDYTKNAVANISSEGSFFKLISIFSPFALILAIFISRKFPKNNLKHSDKNICQF